MRLTNRVEKWAARNLFRQISPIIFFSSYLSYKLIVNHSNNNNNNNNKPFQVKEIICIKLLLILKA
jgi:hypothetical protein